MVTINKLQTSLLGLTMQIPKTKIQEFLVVFSFVLVPEKKLPKES